MKVREERHGNHLQIGDKVEWLIYPEGDAHNLRGTILELVADGCVVVQLPEGCIRVPSRHLAKLTNGKLYASLANGKLYVFLESDLKSKLKEWVN